MKLKLIVKIAMIGSLSVLLPMLVVGLVVPESVLKRLTKSNDDNGQVTIVDGKEVKKTVDPETGETVITTTDPTTGETTVQSTPTEKPTSTPVANTPSTPSTPNTPTTPTNPGTPVSPPIVILDASPTTITSGNSASLIWSATNNASSCTASGSWSGGKLASGSQSVSPTSTSTYTLTCTNGGGSGSRSVTVTVTAPVAACGQPGGSCSFSDIQSYTTAASCRSAINATGSGLSAYAITQSFITAHQTYRSITSLLCGKVYNANLRNQVGNHQNSGATISGSNYETWINNFYLGSYEE
jgi:hypothetical protein